MTENEGGSDESTTSPGTVRKPSLTNITLLMLR